MRQFPDEFRHQARRAKRLVTKTLQQTRRAFFPGSIILCYHRIFEPERDPHLLSVSRENFRQQLHAIKQMAQPARLDQLSEKKTRRAVVITFDDGYLDNLENALPLLREANLPATIYIATGYVGTDREFWWDDLERLTLGATLPKILRLEINGHAREWELEDDVVNRDWNVLMTDQRTARQGLFCDLHAALRPLAEPRQQEVLAQLRELTGILPNARPLHRCMTAAELKTLAAEPLITLGAHTISHCDLDYRTKDEQQTEIAGSKEQLEKIIGRPAEHFSYPYGSFNDESVAVCAENNFRAAVTCIDGPVHRQSHPHRLPRFLVRNWNGPEFERHLKRLFRG